MGRLSLERLRQGRHVLARCLVVALLLPLLLGLLPQPALSASAALDRDLAWSICDPGVATPGERREHGQPHDAQCILCTTGCPVCAPALAAGQPVAFPLRAAPRVSTPRSGSRVWTVLRVLRDGSPTRGPPLS